MRRKVERMWRWLAVLCALALTCFGSAVVLAATGTTVVVSPTGDDSAPGTAARPVRTLAHARDLARAAAAPVTDATRHLWSAPLSFLTRQLYVDGRRAIRATGVAPVSLTKNSTGYR